METGSTATIPEQTIIVPIHEWNDEVRTYLNKAIGSIDRQESIENFPDVLIVYSNKIQKEIIKYKKEQFEIESTGMTIGKNLNIRFLKNNGQTNYQSQVNFGVDNINTKYFTVLEYDDEYSDIYFKNAEKYLRAYPDLSILMPIIVELTPDNQLVRLTNETTWSKSFVGDEAEMGFLSVSLLKQYSYFSLSGAIINREDFQDMGKYKTKIKLTFMQEYLLRILNEQLSVMTMAKIGYKHTTNREGSMFHTYLVSMADYEKKFWFDVAQKEYYYTKDRDIDTNELQEKKQVTEIPEE